MKSIPERKVLVIGRRPKAVRAVERLGWAAVSCPDAPGENILAQGPFAAVLASAESAVIPAAQARLKLGLPSRGMEFYLPLRDKVRMKELARQAGLPCADFVAGDEGRPVAELQALLGERLVVKERQSSGSRGLLISADSQEIQKALGPGKIIERFVPGVESSVESFVQEGEVVFANLTHYHRPGHVNVVPAAFSPQAHEQILELNRRAVTAFGIRRGMVHLEYFLGPEGPVLGELALRPPGGYLMDLLKLAYGFDPWEAWARAELDLPLDLPQSPTSYAAAVILHPGRGRVVRLHGLEEVRALPEVRRLSIKVKGGDVVGARIGLGQDVGRVILCSPDRACLLKALGEVEERLKIEVQA